MNILTAGFITYNLSATSEMFILIFLEVGNLVDFLKKSEEEACMVHVIMKSKGQRDMKAINRSGG
jgi:hypothetical protein